MRTIALLDPEAGPNIHRLFAATCKHWLALLKRIPAYRDLADFLTVVARRKENTGLRS